MRSCISLGTEGLASSVLSAEEGVVEMKKEEKSLLCVLAAFVIAFVLCGANFLYKSCHKLERLERAYDEIMDDNDLCEVVYNEWSCLQLVVQRKGYNQPMEYITYDVHNGQMWFPRWMTSKFAKNLVLLRSAFEHERKKSGVQEEETSPVSSEGVQIMITSGGKAEFTFPEGMSEEKKRKFRIEYDDEMLKALYTAGFTNVSVTVR